LTLTASIVCEASDESDLDNHFDFRINIAAGI
jgi:hypothetical protein